MNDNLKQDIRIELKYVLDEPLAQRVKEWARQQLGVDPHCSASLVDSYDVHTLYLDTPELDLYHRTGVAGQSKHRIRRYGHEKMLWLESKRKKKDVVRKNRTVVSEEEVFQHLIVKAADAAEGITACLDSPSSSQHSGSLPSEQPQVWCGDWFNERMTERRLQPAIQVHYRRFARTATIHDENLRLTIDSQLQASRVDGWHDTLIANHPSHASRFNLSPVHILELKFHNHMPLLFKELLSKFAIPAGGFSKFRTAVSTLGSGQSESHRQTCDCDSTVSTTPNLATSQATNWASDGECISNA